MDHNIIELQKLRCKSKLIDITSRKYGWKNRKTLTRHLRNDNEKAQELTRNRDNKSGEPRKIVAGL